MAYVIYKDPSSFYVFARQVGTASQINPNRIVESQPSYVISAIKEQIRLCSTINLDLTSTHTTVDGTLLENSDRVLLVGQAVPHENGVYFWDAGHQMFFRSQDCFEIRSGFLVVVTEGVAEKDSVWLLTTEDPIEVDVTPIYFVKITTTAFHAATHLYAGIDAVDADRLGIDYVPSNYVRDTSGPLVDDVHHLTAHIQGIDISLGGIEINTGSNLGTGRNVFKQKVGVDFEFRSLTPGSNINMVEGINDIQISATGGTDPNAIHDNVAAEISAIALKVTPVSADLLVIEDSEAVNAKKRISVGSLPGDPNAIHDNVAAEISAIALKIAPVSADLLVIEDSEAVNAKKRISVGSLPGGAGGSAGLYGDSYVLYVSPTHIDAADDNNRNTPFLTIQGSINAIIAAGIWGSVAGSYTRTQVLVSEGRYDESLSIPADAFLTLTAVGPVTLGDGAVALSRFHSTTPRNISWVNDQVVENGGSAAPGGSGRPPTLVINTTTSDSGDGYIDANNMGWRISGNILFEAGADGNTYIEMNLAGVWVVGDVKQWGGMPHSGVLALRMFNSSFSGDLSHLKCYLQTANNCQFDSNVYIDTYERIFESEIAGDWVSNGPAGVRSAGFYDSRLESTINMVGPAGTFVLDKLTNRHLEKAGASLAAGTEKSVLGEDFLGYMALVNPQAYDATDNLSLFTPFVTIQGAVDAVATLPDPVSGGLKTVLIAPGLYIETIIIDSPAIHLLGISNSGGGVVIESALADEPSIVISDATRGSVGTWLSTGPSNYIANWGVLVNSGNPPPRGVTLSNLFLRGSSANAFGLVIAGLAVLPLSVTMVETEAASSTGAYSLWARDVFLFQRNCVATYLGQSLIYDTQLSLEYSRLGAVTADLASEIDGVDFVTGALLLNGASNLGGGGILGYGVRGFHIQGALQATATSTIELKQGYIHGNVTCDGATNYRSRDVFVQGNLSFASGVGQALFYGGGYTGTLTDPDNKFWYYGPNNLWQATNIAWVSPNDRHSQDDGDLSTPFVTIQEAVDTLITAGGGTCYISPGTYGESVIIDSGGIITLKGMGSHLGDVVISPVGVSTLPALLVTNANRDAALLAWMADPTNYLADYYTLDPDSVSAPVVKVEDLTLAGGSSGGYGLVLAGLDGLRVSISLSRVVSNSYPELGLWSNSSCSTWTSCDIQNGQVFLYEEALSSQFYSVNSSFRYIEAHQTSEIYAYYTHFGHDIDWDALKLYDASLAGGDDTHTWGYLHECYFFGNVVQVGLGANWFRACGGTIEGDINCGTTARFHIAGMQVGRVFPCCPAGPSTFSGNITIGNGGSKCVMDGGAYMGSLVDTTPRFERNTGS